MSEYFEREPLCQAAFDKMGEVYHLWTPENFELIFRSDEDFKIGMGIMGICAKLSPDVKILTFELMSNHIHIAAAASESNLREMFELFKKILSRNISTDWSLFQPGIRLLSSLGQVRNVIVYDNRNGYLVNRDYSPYTYPWGANRYYFNPDARKLALANTKKMNYGERRNLVSSHIADEVKDLLIYEGYALPLSFCDIDRAETLFRDQSHYFELLSRSIENSKEIAKEIGESVFYTDGELFAAISKISREKYDNPQPSTLPVASKLELAATMRYDYKAGEKQICRMLKLDPTVLRSVIRV